MLSNLPEINTYSVSVKRFSNEGFSQLHILVAVLALLGGLTFYNSSIKQPQSSSRDAQILGSSQSIRESTDKTGLAVTVKSTGPTWDFYEFLCKSYEECASSLEAGYQMPVISGGQTEGHEILIEPSSDWKQYSYIKYYVKNAWGLNSSQFLPVEPVNLPGTKILTSPDGQSFAISSLAELASLANNTVVFSN